MKLNFSGRRALLLGGSCEMGLALAEAMIDTGLHPVLTYRNAQGQGRILEGLRTHGGYFDAIHLDLEAPEESDGLDEQLDQGMEYLVDMAQGDLEGLVPGVDARLVGKFFDANIRARAIVNQQVARTMLARKKGRMVYISSTAAGMPSPGQGFYAAAKLAAEALYRNLGLELAGRGITTVSLRPGYVDAGRGRQYLDGNARQALGKVPLGRALTIAEIVDTIMFLLCDSALGFNATVLTMDGGLSAGKP
jgi:3-oxoacyl-[acyl-carrier protein] reductase